MTILDLINNLRYNNRYIQETKFVYVSQLPCMKCASGLKKNANKQLVFRLPSRNFLKEFVILVPLPRVERISRKTDMQILSLVS